MSGPRLKERGGAVRLGRRIALAFIAACALAPAISRDARSGDIFDGWEFYGAGELYAWCRSADAADRSACESYVCGVLDAWATQFLLKGAREYRICLPAGVSCAHLADVVVKRLTENPIERQAAAAGAVGYALLKQFPCEAN